MGQYYQAVVGTSQGWNKRIYYPLDFDDGLKLLEHAYVDTYFMQKIHSVIYKKPRRVIWVGDYANKSEDKYYFVSNRNKETKPKSIPKYNFVWGNQASKKCTDKDPADFIVDYEHSYLINHTTQSYLNLKKYYSYSKVNPWGIIDPLPILTAVGNGRGGGDYSGSNENRVGSWKWHLISIDDKVPDMYKKLNARDYSFVEGP